jgi:hypothetical protein
MKNLGYSKGYEKYSKDDLLPDQLNGRKYFYKQEDTSNQNKNP